MPNPFSWNKEANLIYIDQPAGVGFSYGDASDADHDEAEVAEDMYNFLHEFYNGNPDLHNRPLFIFGEVGCNGVERLCFVFCRPPPSILWTRIPNKPCDVL